MRRLFFQLLRAATATWSTATVVRRPVGSATCGFEAEASPCTSDGNDCTDDACDAAGSCEYTNTTDACDDGNAPGSCLAAPKAKFQVADSATAGKDKLSWQWSGGAAFVQDDLG